MVASTASPLDATGDALPYSSPSIVTILVLASYLLFLSVFYHAFQKLFSAGIVGPLVLGAIYARPLANILPSDVQSAVLAIGYLGLILLIVQGGLEARMDILSNPKNLAIALLVGSTGVILPVGISMALLPLGFGFGYLESFAVGAALASTSLGTTFAVLSSFNGSSDITTPGKENSDKSTGNGIGSTRVGTILVGAALLDDIVGLVITSVISTLGSSSETQQAGIAEIKPWTIARPIVSSFLLLVVSWLLCQFALLPLARRIVVPYLVRLVQASHDQSLRVATPTQPRTGSGNRLINCFLNNHGLQQLVAVTLLVSIVLAYCVISEEIGSSLLIGAFCSGAVVKGLYASWTDHSFTQHADSHGQTSDVWSPHHLLSPRTALGVVQDTLLVPFFFSSIGSAIPVKSMFQGTTVWRGVIFAGLMAFAKVGAGFWVFPVDLLEQKWSERKASKPLQKHGSREPTQHDSTAEPVGPSMPLQLLQRSSSAAAIQAIQPGANGASELTSLGLPSHAAQNPAKKPLVWPVSLFLGTALMSRGEIGFLVINIAKQGGLVDQQAFNVAIWAIVLNTLAGPVAVGILMRSRHGHNILGRGPSSNLGRWS